MFDIWFEFPPRLRALMGLGLMGLAALIFYATGMARLPSGWARSA